MKVAGMKYYKGIKKVIDEVFPGNKGLVVSTNVTVKKPGTLNIDIVELHAQFQGGDNSSFLDQNDMSKELAIKLTYALKVSIRWMDIHYQIGPMEDHADQSDGIVISLNFKCR